MPKDFIIDLNEFVKCPKCGEEIELLVGNTYFKDGEGKLLSNHPSVSQRPEHAENHFLNEE